MWAPDFDPEQVRCPCARFKGRLPRSCFVDGHVAAGLKQFALVYPEFGPIVHSSAASTFFPGKQHWIDQSLQFFEQWLKRNKLPTTLLSKAHQFFNQQWFQHCDALETQTRLTWRDVQQVKAKLHGEFVLYNEDHHPNHVVCFCPLFYTRSILTTWEDPKVFQSLPHDVQRWRQAVLSKVPKSLFRKYRWAFNESATLPSGTVFLKAKKSFRKGRTIISYSQSLCCRLLELASITLTMMQKSLYFNVPGMASMPQIWKELHSFLADPTSGPLTEWNDDLVGFFNAVPRADILKAVSHLVEEFLDKVGSPVVSVDLRSKTSHLGNPRGRNVSNHKRCWITDIPDIVQVSFDTGIFEAAGKCRVQKEGTCIGNQISPVLSGLPVLLAEREFFKSLPASLTSEFLFLRYVDNRLLLGTEEVLQHPLLQQFCRPDFYAGIDLEQVQDHQWLGFTIDAFKRTAQFNMPTKPWQIRSPASAGSWRLCASGYFSRAALIRQICLAPTHCVQTTISVEAVVSASGLPSRQFKVNNASLVQFLSDVQRGPHSAQ